MNASELAAKMLEWEVKKNELDALESEIKQAVLELQSSQKVGSVVASYTSGRREFDYETPGKTAPVYWITSNTTRTEYVDWEAAKPLIDPDIVTEFTRIEEKVNWSNVCKDAKIEPLVIKEGTPSVTVKIK